MNHYITTDNKLWGFDDTQTHLIPSGAILIPESYAFDTYPYLTLVNGEIVYDQSKHDADNIALQAAIAAAKSTRASAIAKLNALGITTDEIKSILG